MKNHSNSKGADKRKYSFIFSKRIIFFLHYFYFLFSLSVHLAIKQNMITVAHLQILR